MSDPDLKRHVSRWASEEEGVLVMMPALFKTQRPQQLGLCKDKHSSRLDFVQSPARRQSIGASVMGMWPSSQPPDTVSGDLIRSILYEYSLTTEYRHGVPGTYSLYSTYHYPGSRFYRHRQTPPNIHPPLALANLPRSTPYP